MKRRKKYILFILTIFCISTAFADNKLARIKDPDGFANIRSGQGKDFPIVATVDTTDFIYCDLTIKNDWVKIVMRKLTDGIQIEGFLHRSRIQLVEELDNGKQKELITGILRKQRSLAETFQRTWNSKKNSISRKESELHNDLKYSPILGILPKYFCATNDTTIIELFFSTMWADKGSADETPSFTIAKCFICNPDLIIRELTKLKSQEEQKVILDQIEWGLLNYYGIDKNGKQDNKEFKKLKLQLNKQKSRP